MFLSLLLQASIRKAMESSGSPTKSEYGSSLQFCLLEENLLRDALLIRNIKLFGGEYYLFCEEALHAASRKKNEKRIIFISYTFQGLLFNRVRAISKQILSPLALAHFASLRTDSLPTINRPLFNLSMDKVVAVIDGFSEAQTSRIIREIHNMGGLVVKKLKPYSESRYPSNRRPTHCVVRSALSPSYRIALDWGLTIVTEDWSAEFWRQRSKNIHALSVSSCMIPRSCFFQTCYLRHLRLYFVGFGKISCLHWIAAISSAGGQFVDHFSPNVDFIVINHKCRDLDVQIKRKGDSVRCLQVNLRGENLQFDLHNDQHIVDDQFLTASLSSKILAPIEDFSFETDGGPFQGVNVRKRRLSLESEPEVFYSPKRRLHRASMPLPDSDSPSSHFRGLALGSSGGQHPVYRKLEEPARNSVEVSKRCQRFLELLHTEQNYVRILKGLLNHVKCSFEDEECEYHGLLDVQVLDWVFGNLGDICKIHEEILASMEPLSSPWDESCEIGPIWLQHVFDISKSYPPFINQYEESKATIQDCCAKKPKLRTALKKLLALSDFGRQSLPDLLIRPVQRLPSVLLLLKDLHKNTNPSQSDYASLHHTISEFERVLQFINESKQEYDLNRIIKNVVLEIANAPSYLHSASRRFIMDLDAWESSPGQFSDKGDLLTFFLFDDCLEICSKRWRNKSANFETPRPSTTTPREKLYRHVYWLPLHRVHSVTDQGSQGSSGFSLSFSKDDVSCIYKFTLVPEQLEKKSTFLASIHEHAQHHCSKTDDLENEVDGTISEEKPDGFNKRAMEKARKLASMTSMRVSKVLSNLGARTSGSGIKRAASMMLFSPAKNARSQPKNEQDQDK